VSANSKNATNISASGHRKIEWSKANMSMLARVAEGFAETRPFDGLTIGVSLHIEKKTAVLMTVLRAGGANVVATGNFGTTQDDVAAALNEMGIVVYGRRDDSPSEHDENIAKVLAHSPDLLLDNGADLIHKVIRDPRFSIDNIIGGTEETTSGGFRMREEMAGEVPFPIIVINDSPLKLIVENKHGVGQSIVESFNRITNLMTQGKNIAVIGYGWCGRGIAKYFKALGAQVAVVEINPVTSLEAAVDGHRVMDVLQAAEWADVIITATGRKNVIGVEHFERMKDGVVLGNAGHFPFEIDTPGLFDKSTEVEEFEDGIDSCTLASGKRIVLLCGGRMFNLGGKEPKGNTLECMDMGFTLQALSHECVVKAADELVAGPQPVPTRINNDTALRMLATMS
jgi:adenosylhomocysteinase